MPSIALVDTRRRAIVSSAARRLAMRSLLLVCASAALYPASFPPLPLGVLAGYSQVHFAPLVQIADATGPYGPGMLVAAVNAVIAGVFAARLRGPRPLRSVAGVVAVLAFALVYGEWRLAQHFGDGEAVHVAVVQG